MQFFPDSISYGVSALGGVGLGQSGPGAALANANAFLESLNQELASTGMTPIVDSNAVSGPPPGFRTIKRDISATLDEADIAAITEKLRKRGIDDAALTGIAGLLNADSSPTIGKIMGVIRGNGRANGELTDEDMQELAGVFQKLQLSQEEADELMGYMQEGRGFEAMRLLKAKAKELGENSFNLTAKEAAALGRGLDLSEGAMQKIAGLFTGEDDTKSLEALLSPITEDIATRRSEAEKIAAQFKSVIDEALQEKKIRQQTEPVADTRGNGQTDRAERRMRDDLTAKANGFGKTPEELEEEQSLADEQSAQDRRQEYSRRENASREKTVSVLDGSRDRAVSEKTPSQARSEFTPILSRMDAAPGMTMDGQTDGANQSFMARQNTTTGFAHRQEIFSQVEQGMLRQLADGNRQMTLQLNPSELGQLTLVLSVKAGEVRALIRTDNPETTAALADQMAQLKTTLEEQGLKVAQLDVETQLPGDTTREQWEGADTAQFNKEQEMREQARHQRLAKLRRESGTSLAQDMQSKGMQEEISASGLHIIA